MLRHLITLAALAVVAAALAPNALAVSPNVVISQVYGGGGNTGATYTHDFIELFNRGTASVSLEGWSLQYGSTTGNIGAATDTLTPLSGSIPAGGYVLVREAQGAGGTTGLPAPFLTDTTPIALGSTGGKVALVNSIAPLNCNGTTTPCSTATVVDLVGYGAATFFEGTGPTAATVNTTAAIRNGAGCTDTDNNSADFTVGAPTPRNFATDPITCGGPVNQPVALTCGSTLTTATGVAATRAITARDPDGTVTTISLTSVTPPASGITLGTATPASAPGGTASATLTVAPGVPAGSYAVVLGAANSDATPQTASCSITVSVLAVKTIGEVQGAVFPSDVGTLHRSSFAPPALPANGANNPGQTVVVRGVITQRTLARTASGGSQHGFFLQNTTTTDDDNPLTSDGIFVFMGGFPDLIGGYVPEVGDEVVISGRVTEFFFFTQLSSASLIAELGSFADLDAVTPAFTANPPDDLSEALRYWERLESMRGRVTAGAKAVDGLDVFPSTADGELWVIRADHPVAQRLDPFAQRVFRDPHPLDNQPVPLFDDGNGYRILLASLGVKFAAGDNTKLLTPARTFDTVTNALVGGVYFTFGKYALQVTTQPTLARGVDPSTNAPPSEFARDEAYSIADYNVENLYDYRDDPFDGCDINDIAPENDNRGCPLGATSPVVRPPYDYAPPNDAVYQARLGEIATQIVDDLHAPDILLVQEAEDQDICTVTGGALVCGATDNRDGKPDTLQELALRIGADHGMAYDAAYDRDGSDDRGIVSAFVYRTDRVELLPASADHPVLGSAPDVEYRGTPLAYNTQVSNPKALNADLPSDVDLSTGVDGGDVFTRDPQVGFFRIWRNAVGDGGFIDVYAISNHFSSTPDARIGQRREQAAYNAAIVEALETTAAGARISVGGDFNVYPRPDDPVLPPSDQLGPLYDAGLTNLFDVLVEEAPSAAYSYVFQGQTQTLDGQFLTATALEELNEARAAHVNADFPADTPGDGARGLSDHDPLVAQLTVPSLAALVEYYADAGFITGNNTEAQLLRFLARAELGGPNAEAQLLAFIAHVEGKTPRFITPLAAQALIDDAERLLG